MKISLLICIKYVNLFPSLNSLIFIQSSHNLHAISINFYAIFFNFLAIYVSCIICINIFFNLHQSPRSISIAMPQSKIPSIRVLPPSRFASLVFLPQFTIALQLCQLTICIAGQLRSASNSRSICPGFRNSFN